MSTFGELAVGLGVLGVAALIVILRAPVSRLMHDQQRNMFGHVGESAAGSSAAVSYAVVGGVGVFIGLVYVIACLMQFTR